MWFHPTDYGYLVHQFSSWVLPFISFVMFINMAVSGCLVYETGSGICDEIQKITTNCSRTAESQRQLSKLSENELCLTVWKIVPIKRSFLIATIGTVFTYCILIHNLQQ
ncbi:hypothetical protein CEXT_737101 [Caerostris extrusa]|uniref:Uncharacterized protein n=1 Tax=Caerostris extrusa TaxID=172846 RepID=A0AAV4QG68_CAEEX|nr:hypothetical protein CEXT_737101 [Caerostris extrusa]